MINKDVLLKLETTTSGFQSVAGLRVKKFEAKSKSGLEVDRSEFNQIRYDFINISGSGIMKDQSSDAYIRDLFFQDRIKAWQIVIAEVGILEGMFQIDNLEYNGQHDGEVGFSMGLKSCSNILLYRIPTNQPIKGIRYPEPDSEGHYWAKLISPSNMPEGEDWASTDWEVVQVNDNNGEGDEKWSVAVPGISQSQWLKDFAWGPKISPYKGS